MRLAIRRIFGEMMEDIDGKLNNKKGLHWRRIASSCFSSFFLAFHFLQIYKQFLLQPLISEFNTRKYLRSR